ncbi:MAG: PSD1 domain-containing protein [Planctomycetaceae bacterium]|nr:PSD1 domain-containing protein [Planctomycetaceae bacterium]
MGTKVAHGLCCYLILFCLSCFAILLSSPSSFAGDADPFAFFENEVRPLLVNRCYKCHSGTKAGGGLSLDTAEGWQKGGESGPAIIVGNPHDSLVIEAINYRSLEMPPQDAGGKLSAEEIAVLTKWIADGAPDPRKSPRALGGMTREQAGSWWAFQPLPQCDTDPTSADIDAFIDAKLVEHSLDAVGPADKRTLIRRATYGLTGLPPTSSDVESFVADDGADAFDKVVERLLESPQYGMQWGRHWLDVVRYADTAGENTDRPLPHAWRYRNWVLNAFQGDMPFDEFARLQIRGDIANPESADLPQDEGIIATGYLAIARRFGHDIDKDIHLTYEDVIDNLGKNFLGLSLGCARCHDHKYDPVTSSDYYALYGIFASTRFSFPGCEPKGQPRDLIPLFETSAVDALMADYEQQVTAYEQRLQASAKESQRLKQLAVASSRVLTESTVGEGGSVPLHQHGDEALDRIALRKGEVLQLTVLPNGNHGADTTRVELTFKHLGTQSRWDVSELIPRFTQAGPAIQQNDATWCLLDVTDGPVYLHEKKEAINGQRGLNGWSIGDTPSSIVNASSEPVAVWTTLPPTSFFVHPGVGRNVAVAWVCPEDGEYQVQGVVSDAHPAGLDGVSFRCEHIASSEYGDGLIALGELSLANAAPRPTPPAIPVAYAVAEAEPKDEHIQLRGDPEQLGEEVPRRWLSAFGAQAVSTDGGSGRRELADWVVEHPLFARVMVNRIWQWHFGHGIVATPNDFGSRGEAPTHPELLDWLAAQFRAGGYRIKPIHRLIMNSAAYQRSSTTNTMHVESDPDNRWLSRFTRRRLTAEEIRDSLLAASGQLDLSVGEAHPFPPEASWTFTQHNPFNAIYETNRRSVFMMVQRQQRHPYLALFDGADPNSSTATRQTTTVPTQALYFLNAPFFHDQATALAELTEHQVEDATRTEFIFDRLFQRDPTTSEREATATFLANYPGTLHEKWSAYARVLMASSEFLYID